MFKVFFCLVLLTSPQVFCSAPVFLEAGGSKLCTLNQIGTIPNGIAVQPVYQKVCRQVIPTLADFVDGQKDALSDEVSDDDDQSEKIHRAILGVSERRRACGQKESLRRSLLEKLVNIFKVKKLENVVNMIFGKLNTTTAPVDSTTVAPVETKPTVK